MHRSKRLQREVRQPCCLPGGPRRHDQSWPRANPAGHGPRSRTEAVHNLSLSTSAPVRPQLGGGGDPLRLVRGAECGPPALRTSRQERVKLPAGQPVRRGLQKGDELFLVGEVCEVWLGLACGCSERGGHVGAQSFDAVPGDGRTTRWLAGLLHFHSMRRSSPDAGRYRQTAAGSPPARKAIPSHSRWRTTAPAV